MQIIGFFFMLFAWITPLMSGVDVGRPPEEGYYYYDDDEVYWNGPGYYNGIWFDNEDSWHNYHGRHGGGHYHERHKGSHYNERHRGSHGSGQHH